MILIRWIDFRYGFMQAPYTLGPDGVPVWDYTRVRADAFDDGFSGIPRPITAFPLTISCDNGATTVVNRHHWYLSQRTDDTSLQWLSLTQDDAEVSGTVTLSLTAKCVADMALSGATASLDDGQLREILKHTSLYVVDRFTMAVQWIDLLQYTLSET